MNQQWVAAANRAGQRGQCLERIPRPCCNGDEGSWDLRTTKTFQCQESISFSILLSLSWLWGMWHTVYPMHWSDLPLSESKAQWVPCAATPKTEAAQECYSLQAQLKPWPKQQRVPGEGFSVTLLSRELRCACSQKLEQQHHFASEEAGKRSW